MLTLDTKLVEPISASTTLIRLPDADRAAVCAEIDAGKAVILELHTQDGQELVRAYACRGDDIVVQRGARDTTPRAWPVNTCVCSVDTEPLCQTDTPPECDPCSPPNPWDTVRVGDGLTIDRTEPDAPVLDVKKTNVEGTYGGAVVDSYGRFTYIPPGWPASSLPVFDPCCTDGGGGGGSPDVSAGDVSYEPCGFVAGTTVQDALCELENWASGLSISTGVMTITAGDGIKITGSSTDPVISLEPVPFTPGTYAGFTINQYGQVVGYTPVAVDHPTHTAVAPLHVTYNSGPNEWVHTIDQADYGLVWGVTTYVSVSDITNDTVPAAERDHAITYEGAEALVNRMLATLGTGFDISALPVSTSATGSDSIAIYNWTTNQHERLSLDDLAQFVSTPSVLLEYDPASASMGASAGVSAVTSTSPGVFQVQLVSPVSNPVIHVTLRGDLPLAKVTATLVSTTTIEVRTYDLSVSGATLQATLADHPFWLSVVEDV